jgi:hypothetical protein
MPIVIANLVCRLEVTTPSQISLNRSGTCAVSLFVHNHGASVDGQRLSLAGPIDGSSLVFWFLRRYSISFGR